MFSLALRKYMFQAEDQDEEKKKKKNGDFCFIRHRLRDNNIEQWK